MDNDTLIHYGGEIKNIQESPDGWKFGGYLVVFDSTDVSSMRDRFTKSTDFDIQDGDRRSVYYNHGMDGTVKRTRMGDCRVQIKDAGIWIEGEIKKRSDYLAKHAEQIAMNIKQFGLSSGAPAHLVERKDVEGGHEVTLWPIAEASITPTPAEPMTGCVSLKSLMEPEADEVKSLDELLEDSESEFKAVHKKGDWITLNGAHVQVGGDIHKKIVASGGKEDAAGDNGASGDKAAQTAFLNKHVTVTAGNMRRAEKWHTNDGGLNVDFDPYEDPKMRDKLHGVWIVKQKGKPDQHTNYAGAMDATEKYVKENPSKQKGLGKKSLTGFIFYEDDDDDDDLTQTKNITDLTDSLLDGLTLEDHSIKVLAAAKEIEERVEKFTDMRCIKSQRRLSANNFARFNDLADGLASSAEAIKVLAETHAPLSQEPDAETDIPKDDDLQSLTLQTLWDYQVTLARLHGVAV